MEKIIIPIILVNIEITIIQSDRGECLRVCERVCVITKPERFWALQHIKYSLVFVCGGTTDLNE